MKFPNFFKKSAFIKKLAFFKKSIFIPKLSRRQLISLVGFLVVLVSLPLTVFLVRQEQVYQTEAVGLEARPTRVEITNIHGGGFSVSWVSADKSDDNQFIETTGWIKYGTSSYKLDRVAYDDRGGEDFLSTTHHVSIFNLKPETAYYFKIKSGPYLYGLNITGERWVRGGAVKRRNTKIAFELSGNPHPIYGYVKDQNGNQAEGALVYIRLKKDDSETKSKVLSTVTKASGGWTVDLKNSRTIGQKDRFFDFDNNDRVLIEVQAAQKGTTSADFAVSECSPASDVIL